MSWEKAVSISDLEEKKRALCKIGPKQIVLFQMGSSIFAIDNRCPHQGYPLYEGKLLDDKQEVTCNWHNWKFDLASGKCLTGGDNVKSYPTKSEDGFIWVDLTVPSKEEVTHSILTDLKTAFDKSKYGRMSRELARLHFNDIDPLIAVKKSIEWSHDKLKDGMGHSYAAASEWLRLYFENIGNIENQLICLMEIMDHMSKDVFGQKNRPYPTQKAIFIYEKFLDAIENEDEESAVGMILGALNAGMHFKDLERALTHAALMHYNDFGHSLIYVKSTHRLIELLGEDIEKFLLLALVRSICLATREDLLPEFKEYPAFLKEYPKVKGSREFLPTEIENISQSELFGKSIHISMKWVTETVKTYSEESLYRVLLYSNASHFLYYDIIYETTFDRPVSDNVGWLDFTHPITFANAVRIQCSKFPEFWKHGLLQLACFNGRNSPYIGRDQNVSGWHVKDETIFLSQCVDKILDHGIKDNTVAAHLLKTCMAMKDESRMSASQTKSILLSALNRFFHSPIKEKHVRRAARQNLALVGRDFE